MRYNFPLLLLLALLFISCVNNGDDPTIPPKPESQLPLTNSNLKGTWEQYYYTKSINGGNKMRYFDYDGYTVTFFEDGSFYESNARGEETIKGNYSIASKDTVQFTFPLYDDNMVFLKDTVTKVNIGELTAKRFTYVNNYKLGKYNIQDIRVWRNMQTMPNEHPGVEKETVTVDRLKGKWILDTYAKFINAQLAPDSAEKEKLYKGTTYKYNVDKTYVETNPNGTIGTQGIYKIVDDVVHMFYKGSTKDNPTIRDMSSTIQIKNWTTRTENGVQIEEFLIYDSYVEYSIETNSILTVQTNIKMRRIE